MEYTSDPNRGKRTRSATSPAAGTRPITRRRALGMGSAVVLGLALSACGASTAERQAAESTVSDAAQAPRDEASDAVTAVLDEVSGKYDGARLSLAAYDVAAGRTYAYHPDTWSYEASVVKIPIALSVLRQAKEAGGRLGEHQKDLMTQSVVYSDNAATQQLFLGLGDTQRSITGDLPGSAADTSGIVDYRDPQAAEVLNTTYEKLGVRRTRSQGSWGDDRTWAQDQVQIMRGIAEGVDWVEADDLDYLRSLMTPDNSSQNWGGGVMSGKEVAGRKVTDVSVKNGWLPEDTGAWHITSSAVVTVGEDAYAVAVVSQGFADQQTGQQAASDAVQAYFSAKAA